MITVACVWTGDAFGVEYVERLHDMVRRNLPEGFGGRFVCLTDRPQDLKGLAGVEAITINATHSWFDKMALFHQDSFGPGERIWYFDLDTVITGPLERLFEYPGAFGLLEDVYRKNGFQSSVMSFIARTPLVDSLWEEWQRRGMPRPKGGDQEVLELFWREWLPQRMHKPQSAVWPPDFLQKLYPGVLRSYKVDCVWTVPKGTSVVFFHGLPRPADVLTGWVPEVWKVGGGSSIEIVAIGTVAQDRVVKNVESAIKKGYRDLELQAAHQQVAVIVGGGPSLNDQLSFIGMLQAGGAQVFALNAVDGYLRARGIKPDIHVMMDARAEIHDFVNAGGVKLYASMCDPSVLHAADCHGDLALWHPAIQATQHLMDNKITLGGGTTVGTHALALTWALGYRKILVFGFDSSYADGAHHAYSQTLNDGERILDAVVAGRKFKAAAWMIQQAEDFKGLAVKLASMGVSISIFGDGLLPALIQSLNDKLTERDGLYWPSNDVETRDSVLSTLGDLDHYVGMCTQRRTAIQAGGNVGVWPKHLAKYFTHVITAEPDALNWACLERNVDEPNVRKYQAAFGDVQGTGSVARDPQNCGASAVTPGGDFPIITIDSLNVQDCDLLQLDVEGFELPALLGATETIKRCSPLIVLELKGLGKRYGYEDFEVIEWLQAMDYTQSGVAHRDLIFERKIA